MAGDRVPSLEEIYDEEVLALIEQYTRRPGAARQVSVMQPVDPSTAGVAPVPWTDEDGEPVDDLDDRYDLDVFGVGGEAAPGGRGPDRRAAEIDPPVGDPGRLTRWGVGGAMVMGAMLGVAEVLEPERAKQTIIEFAPDSLDEDQQLVTFIHVPGDPRASRLIIRPWLLSADG